MNYSPLEHEKILRQALESKQDPHKAVASWLLNIPYHQITPEQRTEVKSMNHYLLYSTTFMNTVNWSKTQ